MVTTWFIKEILILPISTHSSSTIKLGVGAYIQEVVEWFNCPHATSLAVKKVVSRKWIIGPVLCSLAALHPQNLSLACEFWPASNEHCRQDYRQTYVCKLWWMWSHLRHIWMTIVSSGSYESPCTQCKEFWMMCCYMETSQNHTTGAIIIVFEKIILAIVHLCVVYHKLGFLLH